MRQTPLDEVSLFLRWFDPITLDLLGFCEIVSGVILISSILDIRRFFKERNDEAYIDLPSLLRHALCFGLYLLGSVGYYVSYTIWVLRINSGWVSTLQNIFFICTIFKYSSGLISELLLMHIFWSLGTKVVVEETRQTNTRFTEAYVDDEEERDEVGELELRDRMDTHESILETLACEFDPDAEI